MTCLHLYEQKIITGECIIESPSLLPRDFKVQDINNNQQFETSCNEYNEMRLKKPN